MGRFSRLEAWTGQVAHLVTPGRAAALVLAAAALAPPAWLQHAPVLCPFRLATGLPCPGCGITRSLVALAHGDLSAAIYFHPLGAVVGALLVALVALELLERARVAGWWPGQAGGSAWTTTPLDLAARGPLPWVGVAAVILVWAIRLPMFVSGAWVY